MRRISWLLAILGLVLASPAYASNCSGNPYTLTNGTTADANQVMSNFNNLLTCANSNLAHNGANSDITSLSGLSTPLSVAQGGTGAATASAAAANLSVASISSANTFTASQAITVNGNATLTATTSNSANLASLTAEGDTGRTANLQLYGSTYSGTFLGLSQANLAVLSTAGAGNTQLAIGTVGTANMTLGTDNTAQLLFTQGGGITTSGVAGGDKGAGSLNVGSLYIGGTAPGNTCSTHQWVNTISSGAVGSCTQPATTDISGLGSIATENVFATTTAVPGAGSAITPVNHGLGGVPTRVDAYLICTTGELGYTAGDIIPAPTPDGSSHGFVPFGNSTQVGGIEGSSGIHILNKSTGGDGTITTADWNVEVVAVK